MKSKINVPICEPDDRAKEGEHLVEINGNAKMFSFKYSQMYNAPELSYKMLRKLSEYFGTEEIDTDSFSQSGCETCDYGSDYGFEIQVHNATKNNPYL